MSYLCARKQGGRGCVTIEMPRGKEMAALVTDLSRKKSGKGVEIFSITSMEAYGEYKPYLVLKNLDEFVANVMAM